MAGNASNNQEDTLIMSVDFNSFQAKFAELFAAVFWEVNYVNSADAGAPLVATRRFVFYAPRPGIPDAGAVAPGKAALHRPFQQQRQSKLT